MLKISFSDIEKSAYRINPFIKQTSLTRSSYFSKLFKTNLFFKWESEQEIRSFKIRGALNKILSLKPEESKKGLIAASAGNHAQGVAWAARHAKVKARVVMMKAASKIKIEATKKHGAEIILKGNTYDESYVHAQSIKGNSLFIHPFADPLIMAGQGTLGREIVQQLPEVTSVVVSIGGGGLISGVSVALKHLRPQCRIYGVVWDGTPSQCRQFHGIGKGQHCLCGKSVKENRVSEAGLTDGLAVKKPHPGMFESFSPFVEDIVCVSREEIGQSLSDLCRFEGKVAEGSGIAPLAALMGKGKKWNLGTHCCLVVSGANIDPLTLSKIVKTVQK